jgi:ribonuclease R
MVNKTSAIAKYIKIIVSDTRNDKISSHLLFGLLVKKFGEQLGRLSEQEFQSGVDAAAAQGIIERTNTNDFLIKKTNLHHHQNNNFRPHQQSYKGDENAPRVKGTIHLNAAGNGFITLIGEQKATFYVQKTNVNGAQDGDIVEAVKTNFDTPGDLIDAKVMEVIEHSKDYYVGEFALDKLGKYQVILDDQKNTLKIMLNNINGLVNGSKILIHVTDYKANGIAYGEVTKILGHKTDVGVDIMSIVYDNGVNPDFSDEVLNYAKTIKLDIDEEQARVRTDLSDKPIITIDPATSKDFDDAFYCEKRGEKYFLSVSIADVSHYVKYDDILDKEALRRGCSIYLVDRVIPMLPHNLSDDLCSIVEHQPRFALTCDMVINKTGETEDIKVYPTIINSHRRFSYDEVNDYFANHQVFEKEEKAVVQSIDVGLELSDILKKMKDARGYIAFDVPKANIVVDEHGEPVDITREVHGRAQEMIEDFMVAANEAVTVYAKKHNFPFVYRIHEKPDEKRLATFAIEAKKLGFKITTDIDDIKPHDISE